MPIQPMYSPQPRGRRYFTLVPINSDPNMDCGPLHSFAVATLYVASHEGQGGDIDIWIKLPPCFGSSKQSKLELIKEGVLSRGPLWQHVHYVERRASGEVVMGKNGQSLCQELEISLCSPSGKVSYTPTGTGHVAPLTLAACHPSWDDYQDLGETLGEMSQCLIDEDGQLEGVTPRGGTLPKQKDTTQIMALPPNDDTTFMPMSEFPGSQYGLGTCDNPVNLSDAPTEALHTATPPESVEPIDEVAMLGHFSDALSEMATSLLDLEDAILRPFGR